MGGDCDGIRHQEAPFLLDLVPVEVSFAPIGQKSGLRLNNQLQQIFDVWAKKFLMNVKSVSMNVKFRGMGFLLVYLMLERNLSTVIFR